jgi:predicted ATPase
VGGVGKTRLAIQVAAELTGEFPDGVWLVELAPVGDPTAVPEAVAAVLGVTPKAGLSVADGIAQALIGRRLLMLLDNCEHLLDAAAGLVDTTLAQSATVRVVATSREGLRAPGEHVWFVPSLDVAAGVASPAVELFVERARAVRANFDLDEEADSTAVTEICRRLDGIALAIELAAARMVSMSPSEVLDRLNDRFRLLSGPSRGLERHQTLRHAVAWSYDLLDHDQRRLLVRCSLFADGFDLAAATHVCGDAADEYVVLDLLDSLVRKSLVTAERVNGHTRYQLLETIRQFAEDHLADAGTIEELRDRHAHYFADQANRYWDLWDGPNQRAAIDWVDAEFANLRVGFRWATNRSDLDTAAAIAAHTAALAWVLPRFEAVGWAEELLVAATTADLRQLPRLYTAASLCSYAGRPEIAVGYAQTAVELGGDPRYDPFDPGWSGFWEGVAHIYVGRLDRTVAIGARLAAQPGLARIAGLTVIAGLPTVGRAEEAAAVADEAVQAARSHNNPYFIALALLACGRAFSQNDPARALRVLQEGLLFVRDHRIPYLDPIIAREAAELEAIHGDLGQGLVLFETVIEAFYRAGEVGNLHIALAHLAVVFDRFEQPAIAATLYGTSGHHGDLAWVLNLPGTVEHLHAVLDDTKFNQCVAAGAAMESADAVAYARDEIQAARRQFAGPT